MLHAAGKRGPKNILKPWPTEDIPDWQALGESLLLTVLDDDVGALVGSDHALDSLEHFLPLLGSQD